MMTILIIEDEAQLREEVREFLEYEEYRVLEASDGESGLQMALEQAPDLILCDMMMPGINGNEVFERLQANPRTDHIPFVMLTASASQEEIENSLSLGIDGYIVKPFEIDVILSKIQQFA